MTNSVAISGRIEEIFDMTEGVKLATLRCNDALYYIFWEEENFIATDLLRAYVCIQGYLQYIKYRKEGNTNVSRILAICVDRMEKYEI